MFRVYRDGRCISADSGPVDAVDQWLIRWAEGFLPEEERTELEQITYPLPHGIQLAAYDIREPIAASQVADFLADALRHFKHHRDDLKTGPYTAGPYRGVVRQPRRRALCHLRLTHPGDAAGQPLTAAQWVEAVARAYASANTLVQIVADLDAFKKAAAREPRSWVADAIEMLGRPYGELRALRIVLRDAVRWDAESDNAR
jgi:hypothetical protein